MRTFIIDHENNITILAAENPSRGSEGVEVFTTKPELAKLADAWPTGRLVEIWNCLTGVTPVKKFTDRKTAVSRIWKTIQSLQPAASKDGHEKAAPAQNVGPRRAAKPKAARKATAPTKSEREPKGAREGSKKAALLKLVRRPTGATLDELVNATGWNANSVRGFISGQLGKKMGLNVESTKREDGKRKYQVVS